MSQSKQWVVLDDEATQYIDVLSGIPQGTTLGPVWFLLFLDDLPNGHWSKVWLFAEDCVLYWEIKTPTDAAIIQQDLNTLGNWERGWQMFNIDFIY